MFVYMFVYTCTSVLYTVCVHVYTQRFSVSIFSQGTFSVVSKSGFSLDKYENSDVFLLSSGVLLLTPRKKTQGVLQSPSNVQGRSKKVHNSFYS